LIDIPEQPQTPKRPTKGLVKLRSVDRRQTILATLEIDDFIPADHKARAIWELVGSLDLSRFTEPLRTTVGCAGRPAWDPLLLVSLWVYAYSEGIGSAREIEKLMHWEPGMQWLAGLEKVNHHTLSDFRVEHQKALDELFSQLLAMLESAGLVSLKQVMHDGTKIRAQAGADTLRREKTLRERLEQARAVVEQLRDPDAEPPARDRKQAARERAARERAERLESALAEWATLAAEQKSESEKAAVRVSITEPEVRVMKHGDHAIAPSYNAQISTDAEHKIIVGARLSQSSSDDASLIAAIDEVGENLQQQPEQLVVDGGYTSRKNIQHCAARKIDLVGPLGDPEKKAAGAMKSLGIDPAFAPHQFRVLADGVGLECPAGQRLEPFKKNRKRGDLYQQYRARAGVCGSCRHQPQCCPKGAAKRRTVSLRLEEPPDVVAFRRKMATPEYRDAYKRRGEVAEFPNAWLKDKLGLRKFQVRGLAKAGSELLWACLTYNIMQWARLVWRQPAAA
jgi:transposase